MFSQKANSPYRSLSFMKADSLDKKRAWVAYGGSTGIVSGVTIWLYSSWYKQYDRTKFHFFNDNHEWLQMDKLGHITSTYYESRWGSQIYRWTGMRPRKADWIGVGYGMAIQSTLEIADGFSAKWGFSKGDYLANIIGATTFIGQQIAWDEQRISLKVSSTPKKYPNAPIYSTDGKYSIPLSTRAYNLLGDNYATSFLKDYNEQTIWASVNVASFLSRESKFPKWLNVAVGYSIENAFVGANSYQWTQTDSKNSIPAGTTFIINPTQFPRYRQYLFSLDIDLTKVKTKNKLLTALIHSFNVIKIPSPTLEVNSLGKIKGHWLYF